MSGMKSKSKGYRGEKEVIGILLEIINRVYSAHGAPAPELARSGIGRDIIGLPWVAIEVKRHERDNPFVVNEWWTQAKAQSEGREPILFYRMNNRPWIIRMFGFLHAGPLHVRCPVDISLPAFQVWFESSLKSRFKS